MIRWLMVAMLTAAPLSLAQADRAPTAEERAKIEQVLRAAGFTKWDQIEFEDNRVWEVDDAVAADGKKYDLKLDEQLTITDRRPD